MQSNDAEMNPRAQGHGHRRVPRLPGRLGRRQTRRAPETAVVPRGEHLGHGLRSRGRGQPRRPAHVQPGREARNRLRQAHSRGGRQRRAHHAAVHAPEREQARGLHALLGRRQARGGREGGLPRADHLRAVRQEPEGAQAGRRACIATRRSTKTILATPSSWAPPRACTPTPTCRGKFKLMAHSKHGGGCPTSTGFTAEPMQDTLANGQRGRRPPPTPKKAKAVEIGLEGMGLRGELVRGHVDP